MKKGKRSKEVINYLPHVCATEIRFLKQIDIPEIVISDEAYIDMVYLCEEAGNSEIGWVGSVDKIPEGYFIRKVWVLPQTVGSASTESTSSQYAELLTRLCVEGQVEEVNKIRFWGHLHPSSSTKPSGIDKEQMGLFSKDCDYYIRAILGRGGRAEFCVFDYIAGLQYDDVKWKIKFLENEERQKFIKNEVAKYVKKYTYIPIAPNYSMWGGKDYSGLDNVVGM